MVFNVVIKYSVSPLNQIPRRTDKISNLDGFGFKGVIYIGKSRFGTTYHAWYRGDSSRDLVQKHLCINYILLPGRKPGTSTNVTIGMLNESQNLTNLAPLTEALMSKQPETENNGIE